LPAESFAVKEIAPVAVPEAVTTVDSSLAVIAVGLPTKVMVFAACERLTPPIEAVKVPTPAVPSL